MSYLITRKKGTKEIVSVKEFKSLAEIGSSGCDGSRYYTTTQDTCPIDELKGKNELRVVYAKNDDKRV